MTEPKLDYRWHLRQVMATREMFSTTDLIVPLAFKPDQINHDFHWLLAMGRLKDSVSIKQAQSDMDSVTKHIGEVYPQDIRMGSERGAAAQRFSPQGGDPGPVLPDGWSRIRPADRLRQRV